MRKWKFSTKCLTSQSLSDKQLIKFHNIPILNLKRCNMSDDSPPESDSSEKEPPPTYANTVINGICNNCNSDDTEGFVSCLFCKSRFNLNGCFANGDFNILNNSDA